MAGLSTLRACALVAAGFCTATAAADIFVDTPGPNNLDIIDDGSFIATGIDSGFSPVSGVFATNNLPKTFDSLYAWSDSQVTLNAASFFGFDLQAHDTSVINYNGGINPTLTLVTFDDAVINVTGGTIGFLGTGGGTGNGGTAVVSGGSITEVVSCAGGTMLVSGGSFGTPTYGLPYSFISLIPSGITFQGTGIVATYMGVDVGNGFDGNAWLLSGTLSDGTSVDGLYMVDVGIFDPTVIVNYAGVTIAGGDVDEAPVANAGVDFSVNEGQVIQLDGTQSFDPDDDELTYSWTQLGGGPMVILVGADTAGPVFTAPTVAFGGETLSFQLTVTANGVSSTDTVSVSVVNINHAPVANAGAGQTVVEGSTVTLHGEGSFDIDGDSLSYAWTQVSGPSVFLSGANTVNPTFPAPWVISGGASLVFQLTVDDGYPPDAAADGHDLSDIVATVTITVTNVNHVPTANAGPCNLVNELTVVSLNGLGSTDPDGDTLSYSWTQLCGPSVVLTGANSGTPTFMAPAVNSCGFTLLKFRLTVNDGFGGSDTDEVIILVRNVGSPPDITHARPSECELWPPNHQLECITIQGIACQNSGGNINVVITGVKQDEPTNGLGDGDTAIDAIIKPNGKVLLRAERKGNGNGRVYTISFTASNNAGSVSGKVKVGVPKSKNGANAVDGGELYISTQ
jgi:hypothetical protein